MNLRKLVRLDFKRIAYWARARAEHEAREMAKRDEHAPAFLAHYEPYAQ